VSVSSSDANIATIASGTVVHAGDQVATIDLITGAAGTATLTVEAAGIRRELTIVVGSDPTPTTTAPITAGPAGVSVVPNPSIGRVFGQLGVATIATLGVPLLTNPAANPTSVVITSSDPTIATVGGGATIAVEIPTGARTLDLPVATTGAQGASLLTFEFDGVRRELLIVVGDPPASEIPAVTAPVVGVRIEQ
jgi:hypothetical protein